MTHHWFRNVALAGLGLVLANTAVQSEDKIKPQPKPDKSYTIGVLEPNLAIPHFVAQAYGFTDEAQKMGMKVIMYDAGEHKNVAKQVSQMEDLITNKVDVIAFVPHKRDRDGADRSGIGGRYSGGQCQYHVRSHQGFGPRPL